MIYNPVRMWSDKNGNRFYIRDMSISYIIRCIKFLTRIIVIKRLVKGHTDDLHFCQAEKYFIKCFDLELEYRYNKLNETKYVSS